MYGLTLIVAVQKLNARFGAIPAYVIHGNGANLGGNKVVAPVSIAATIKRQEIEELQKPVIF